MKKFKYFPVYFVVVFCMSVIGQKFNLVIRGTPIGGHSWPEIWRNMPLIIIVTTVWAFIINQGLNEIRKMQSKDTIKAKERIADREKYSSAPNIHECRVCGCYSDDFPWGEDGRSPSYAICSCCGVQFGKEDITLDSIKKYREEWISKGGKWFVKDEKPEHWDMETQIKKVPHEFM
jgi:hypothetical protein